MKRYYTHFDMEGERIGFDYYDETGPYLKGAILALINLMGVILLFY